MARLARAEVFSSSEVAVVHVMNRVVRRCFLLGNDPVSGKNYDHRKQWIEDQLRRQAACFGIDLLGFAILSNHFHLILWSRPDCVQQWDDIEVARRWRRKDNRDTQYFGRRQNGQAIMKEQSLNGNFRNREFCVRR